MRDPLCDLRRHGTERKPWRDIADHHLLDHLRQCGPGKELPAGKDAEDLLVACYMH